MRHKKLQLCTILLLGIGLADVYSQQTIPSTGGNGSGSGGKVSYSAGQTFYHTNPGSNGTEAQGVQQPYEISELTGIEDKGIHLVISAYPNPVTDFLLLKIEASTLINLQPLYYQLFDINGKLLMNRNIESNETPVSMKKLVPGTYILKVIEAQSTGNQKEIKTYQIIKN